MGRKLKSKHNSFNQDSPVRKLGDYGCGIVIDLGSETIRIGLAGDDAPRHTFKSKLARKDGKIYIGKDADGMKEAKHPI